MESNSPMEEIYRRYAKTVNIYVLSMCKNHDLADDITADTFLKALKNIDKYSGENILTWLCTIAKNTLFDYAKKKEQINIPLTDEMEHTLSDTKNLPEKTLVEKDEKMILYKNLQRLEPQSREVVYLRMFTELSFKEIGTILNKSENWARVIFYRSKNKLKGLMNDEKLFTV